MIVWCLAEVFADFACALVGSIFRKVPFLSCGDDELTNEQRGGGGGCAIMNE